MKNTFLKLLQFLLICFFLIDTYTFAQTGQKGSDYPVIKNKHIAVIVIDFPDTPKSIKDQFFPTIAALKDTIFNGSITKYFTDMSFGQFTLTGDVFGYFTHQSPGYVKDGYTSMVDILKINTINIPGFDINKYDGFAIVPITDVMPEGGMTSNNEFLINGNLVHKDFIYVPIVIGYMERDPIKYRELINTLISQVGYVIPLNDGNAIDDGNDRTTLINYSQFNYVFSHELGHFLGMGRHANSRTNGTSYDFEPEVSNNNCLCYGTGSPLGSLLSREYGNWYDLMGNGRYGMSLNMGFRDYFGWTNASNQYSIKDYGHFTTTIYPENNVNGIRSVEIRIPYRYNDINKKNKGYFLEVKSGTYRWDRMLLHPQLQGNNDGVMVMKTDGYNSELLDMSPSANINFLGTIYPDIRDVVLKPGMVYKNREIQLSNVRKNANGSFSIDVDVYISEPKVNLNDSLALVALYNQCDGKNWTKKKNWLSGRVETWEGIIVENGRVVDVNLESIGLSGQLPSEISNLTQIRSLNLNWNQLTEIYPASWSNLVNIEQLAFYGNQLSSFPDLSAMSKLKNLDCRYNFLDFGDIEPYIGFPKYGFSYEPQSTVGKSEIIIKKLGEECRISVTVGGKSNKYQWYKNGVNITGATATAFVIPLVKSEDAGIYTCQIINTVATQLTLTSNPITLQIMNQAPVANAGVDQSVNEGSIVSLDGSASSDPDGTSMMYNWTAPTGITLNSTTIAKPTFIAPEVTINTNYTFSLVVNDGTVDSPADQVVITIKNVNKAPVASASIDQSINEGATVSLDGSASSDPDGNLLTYKWTASAGITLSSTTAVKPTFMAPEVTTNTDFTFSLVVNDGTVDSPVDQVVITVKNVNKAPVANAGVDQSVNEGSIVSLDGSASSDPDGNQLTYKWTAPAGISLSSTTAAKPSFTTPEVTVNTNYTFSLVVNDGTVDSPADQVVITVKNVNKVPVANAGIDQSVNEGSTVSLDGSTSSDPDGNPITYKWTAPAGITLSSTTTAKPGFTAPEVTINTNYTFSLVVNDGMVDSQVDQVVITVKNVNKAPVANAGVDQSVNEGAYVSLDGSASSDPDGNPLTYKWTAPAGITLSSTTVAKPTFAAPEVTTNTNYTFSLVVNDGTVDSPVDQVVITVKNVNKAPVANAGVDQSVNEGATVSLDGSASSDADGTSLTYKWTAPTGIALSSMTIAKPTFTAPEVKKDSTLNFLLVVNDGLVSSLPSTVKVTVLNVIKVGVTEISVQHAFKVYPNPVTNELIIEFEDNSTKTDFQILNSIGQVVFTGVMLYKTVVQTNHFTPGIYFIKLKSGETFEFKKIVKS